MFHVYYAFIIAVKDRAERRQKYYPEDVSVRRPGRRADGSPTYSGTKHRAQRCRKHVGNRSSRGDVEDVVDGAVAASSRTTRPWPDMNRHEGQRICVGNRYSRGQCRRRGRRADSSPARSGTKDPQARNLGHVTCRATCEFQDGGCQTSV